MQLLKIEKRKGISPLIATLLLIAIAVAASVLTYSWVMSMIGSQSAQAQTQLRIDGVNWATDSVIKIRNTGSVDAVLESVMVRANTAGSSWTTYDNSNPLAKKLTPSVSLPTGTMKDIAVDGLAGTAGESYVIRATAATGFYYEAVFTVPLAS